jgi:hypothetical protein
LLIPQDQAVEVLPANGQPHHHKQFELLEAGPEFPGLQLQFTQIWAPD